MEHYTNVIRAAYTQITRCMSTMAPTQGDSQAVGREGASDR